ncbi:MAG: ABC transporter ATP-binding protein [Proteobacteria bacterium]|nr:ABC transporter ATP-binding protein [Pseudomonadota bacterium]MBU1743155.1 ABC transporter ATP-binding protein [Pseudomonadota bacterium]
MSLISAHELSRQYGDGPGAVEAVSGVSLEIAAGEFVAVVGESGSGKSTLLTILGGLNSPTRGRYEVDGVDVYALSPNRRADFRRKYIGFVFQSFHLLPYLNLVENVMLPLAVTRMSDQDQRVRALDALARVGLADKADRRPDQVSGGEQERAAVARAIVGRTPIVLADEPTGNLDVKNGRQTIALLRSLVDQGTTVIMVTHSREYARAASRTVLLRDGRIVADGPAADEGLVETNPLAWTLAGG